MRSPRAVNLDDILIKASTLHYLKIQFKNTTFSYIDKTLRIIQYRIARGMNKLYDVVNRITIWFRCVQFVR